MITQKSKIILFVVALIIFSGALGFGAYRVFALTVSNPAGVGYGALGMDSSFNVSVGSSSPNGAARFVVNASSGASTYTLKVLSNTGASLFSVDNSGNVVAAGSLSAGSFSGNISGTVTANNVSSGAFGANSSGGNFSFPASVGIGIASPVAMLHVAQSSNSQPAALFTNNGGSGEGVDIKAGAGGTSNAVLNAMQFNGTSLFYVRGDGNVGIGTTGPSQKLEVVGNVSSTGLCLSGVCITTWPTGNVTSVFGRTGAVVAASGDYSVAQVTGAAPLASPTFTGTLTLPGTHGGASFLDGGGDAASYSADTVEFSGWNGLGMYNPTTGGAYTNQISGFYDFRNGFWDTKAYPRVNGTAINSIFAPLASPTFTGQVYVATPGGAWISGMTTAGITASNAQTASAYTPMLRQTTASGDVVNLGGLGDNFGFFGYASGRTVNGYDYNMTMNLANGYVGIGTTGPDQLLTVNGKVDATGYCISGANCISSWPTGGTGTVTSVAAGTGLSGGTITTSGTISLNTANANTWTGAQTFNAATTHTAAVTFPGSGIWNASGNVGIGTTAPIVPLSIGGAGQSFYMVSVSSTAANYMGINVVTTGQGINVSSSGGSLLYGSTAETSGYAISVSAPSTGSVGIYAAGNTFGGHFTANGSAGAGVYGSSYYGVEGYGTYVGVYSSGTSYDFLGSHGEYTSGSSWVNGSSRDLKTDFTPLDDQIVLSKIDALPVTKWVYKTDTNAWHIGPMAEDFYASFGLGDNNMSISTIDPSGVALVGIKALDEKIDAQQKEIDVLNAQNATLSSEVEKLLSK